MTDVYWPHVVSVCRDSFSPLEFGLFGVACLLIGFIAGVGALAWSTRDRA